MKKLTLDEIRSFLAYESETGIFTWLKKTGRSKPGKIAGTLASNGYIQIKILGNQFLAHRLAWYMHSGEMPSLQIDHINHIRSDNRIKNLRPVSNQGNSRNSSLSHRSSTGVVGVSYNSSNGYYEAHIGVNGKKIHLGWHKSLASAVEARKVAAHSYGFHKLHGDGLSPNPKKRKDPREVDPRQLSIIQTEGQV